MDDTSDIKGRLHREIVTTATTNLFIITHDTKFCLPELQTILGNGVAQLLSNLTHIGHRGISPIAMSHHELGHVRHIPQISLDTILREEGAYLIATLPVGLVGSQHTAQITGFIDNNLCGKPLFLKGLTSLAHQSGYLPISGRRTFLLGAQPVPMTIRFVHWTEIIKVDTIMLLYAFHRRSHELSKIIIAVILQVDITSTTSISGQSVLSEIYWSGIQECQEIRHATFLGES